MILEILRNCIASTSNPDEAVLNIQKSLGGGSHYIPSAKNIDARNSDIKAFFNGRNAVETCKHFGISARTLYRIINS